MGGVYGTMMPYVADQFRDLTVYSATSNITAGFSEPTNIRTIRGVIHMYSAPPTAEGIKAGVPSFQGLGKGNAVVQKRPFMWADVEVPVGDFITCEDSYPGAVFRAITENQWLHESDLVEQGLEKVVGLNGANSNNLAFNVGTNTFD
jgi:hypothetical protein